jgi:hypothetical protein
MLVKLTSKLLTANDKPVGAGEDTKVPILWGSFKPRRNRPYLMGHIVGPFPTVLYSFHEIAIVDLMTLHKLPQVSPSLSFGQSDALGINVVMQPIVQIWHD